MPDLIQAPFSTALLMSQNQWQKFLQNSQILYSMIRKKYRTLVIYFLAAAYSFRESDEENYYKWFKMCKNAKFKVSWKLSKGKWIKSVF